MRFEKIWWCNFFGDTFCREVLFVQRCIFYFQPTPSDGRVIGHMTHDFAKLSL